MTAVMQPMLENHLDENNMSVYGTFVLGDLEFGIDVKEVLEVVNFPNVVIPMPLSPDFVMGLFNLRGLIIPILDMSCLLNTSSSQVKERKVIILAHQGVKFGLVFDGTGEILKVPPAELTEVAYARDQDDVLARDMAGKVIVGVVKLEAGQRLVQIIRTAELAKIQNLPHMLDTLKPDFGRNDKPLASYVPCISFRVGPYLLALKMEAIREISQMLDCKKTALTSELCLGVCTLRGMILPLIDLSKLLGQARQNDPIDFKKKKVIIMSLADEGFGLVIDHVENILWYSEEEDLKPVPLFNKDRNQLLFGCIAKKGREDILLLDHEKLMNGEEMTTITNGHSQLYKTGQKLDKKYQNKTGQKHSYITFHLHHRVALPILDIQEIIEFPKAINPTPGTPPVIRGMLNLRGQLVPVIDLRRMYQLPTLSQENLAKVLIVHTQKEKVGLMVDSVDGLITINDEHKLSVPKLLQSETSEAIHSDVKEYIETEGDSLCRSSLMIFDLNAILERVQNHLNH